MLKMLEEIIISLNFNQIDKVNFSKTRVKTPSGTKLIQ